MKIGLLAVLISCANLCGSTLSDRWDKYIAPENYGWDGGGKLGLNRERLAWILLGQAQGSEYFVQDPAPNGDWYVNDGGSPNFQMAGIVPRTLTPETTHDYKPENLTFSAIVWNSGYQDDQGHTPWPHSQAWVRKRIVDYLQNNGIDAEIRYFIPKGVKGEKALTYSWCDAGKVIVQVKERFGIQTNITFIYPPDLNTANLKHFERIYDSKKEHLYIHTQGGTLTGHPIPNDQ